MVTLYGGVILYNELQDKYVRFEQTNKLIKSMELIKWTNEYSVGVEEIDNQHKGLIILINELFTLMSEGKAKSKLNEIFDHLTNYTKIHFKTEEIMLYKFAYKDLDSHKQEHKNFIEKLKDFKKEFETGKVTISIEILNFLKNWLINHICISDKNYSSYIKNNY